MTKTTRAGTAAFPVGGGRDARCRHRERIADAKERITVGDRVIPAG
jgi:hypothetical protein